jgi:rubrerythrin
MGVFFDVSEVFQFAIRIEENGERFYRKVAEKNSDKEIKSLFTFLADEETSHKKIFTDMLKKVNNYQLSETYPGEYFQYLRSYADTLIFPPEIDRELGVSPELLKVLDFGIRRELDSIMYYLEAKSFVQETQHRILDNIINEERNHFLKLSRMKENITKKGV